MNIRLRLILWYTAVLFFILVVFSLAVYIGLTRSLFVTVDNHLQHEVGEILGNLSFGPPPDEEEEEEEHETDDDQPEPLIVANVSPDQTLRLSYQPEEGTFWRILDAAGRPLLDPGDFEGAPIEQEPTIPQEIHLENTTLADQTPIRLYSVPFVIENQGRGVIQVAESYRHIQDVQRQLLFLLAIGIPFTLLAASAGGWFLAASALNPIDRITRTAQEISADDLHQRLNLALPNDEVGRLAATFDQMLSRLEEAFERQKRFIADASHEMRTPLTILKGDVEVALNRPRSNQEYRHTLEMVNQTTDRLTALVQELFTLARADNQQFPLIRETVDLSRLLSHEVAALQPHARKKEITLTLHTPETLLLPADPAKLARLFTNLIDNAIKYSRPGDSVTVTATPQEDQVAVTVADTGAGIPPEHLPHLFDRFYRIDKARSRLASSKHSSGTGAGLGLSIAQWLAQVHEGRIEVSSAEGQGSVFTVYLPLAPDPQPEPINVDEQE